MSRAAAARPGQLRPLVRLRWQMVRSPVRRGLIVGGLVAMAGLLTLMVVATVRTVPTIELPVDLTTQALLVYPAALLLFTVVAIVAPFLAGGAIELFPPSQMVAYPIAPRTRFAASLLLMPLNLTWLLQVVLLTFLVAVGGAGEVWLWTLAAVTAVFVLTATVAGQALAWTGTAVRQTRTGRYLTNAAAAVLLVLAALNFNQDTLFSIANSSPLLPVLGSGLAPLGPRFWVTLALLVAIAVAARSLGVLAVGWSLRLGQETSGHREGSRHRPRREQSSPTDMLTVTLLGSVWRSRPVRRGLLLLVVMPVAVAAVADLQWSQIVALPGLVAAGAALLFGVNGFSLLGGGAAWLGSQPIPEGALLRSLAVTITAVVGGATVLTTAGVGLFAPGTPTSPELVALLVGALASIAWITASALRHSVRSPYQADLRGNRDAPAPPGAMAGYSVRLAGTVGVLGLCLVATAQLGRPGAALMLGILVLLAASVRLLRTWLVWRAPSVRSHTLLTVAFG
jgi:hypothetical protein